MTTDDDSVGGCRRLPEAQNPEKSLPRATGQSRVAQQIEQGQNDLGDDQSWLPMHPLSRSIPSFTAAPFLLEVMAYIHTQEHTTDHSSPTWSNLVVCIACVSDVEMQ